MKLKQVVLTAVVTSLVTNFLLSSWLFWIVLFIGLWFYLGYLGNIVDDPPLNDPLFMIMGPISLIVCLIYNRTRGLKRLWRHFFKKPIPSIRSPFVFKEETETDKSSFFNNELNPPSKLDNRE